MRSSTLSYVDHYLEMISEGEKGNPLLALCLDDFKRNDSRLRAAFFHFEKIGLGATFTNSQTNQWGTVIKDATVAGSFRYQIFDKHGFVMHGTYATAQQALFELVDTMGIYSPTCSSMLDKLASTSEWKRGTYRIGLLHKLSAGLIDMVEANRLASEYDAKQAA